MKSPVSTQIYRKQRNISTIDTQNDSSSSSSELYIGVLDTTVDEDAVNFPWIETPQINGNNVPSKVVTGAEADVLPLKVLKRLGPFRLQATSVTLRAFGG